MTCLIASNMHDYGLQKQNFEEAIFRHDIHHFYVPFLKKIQLGPLISRGQN